MLAGQEMVGGVVSLTVNVVVQVVALLQASLTVIVTVVAPKPTNVPAVGLCVFVREPLAVQLSVAVTPPVKSGTAAWQAPFALAVCEGAQAVIIGAVVSCTVTTFWQVLEQPFLVTVRVKVKVWLQFGPAVTLTDWLVVEPTMESPVPEIDQE